MVYGTGIFVCGMVCSFLRLASAYRFAAITLSVVLLIAHQRPPLDRRFSPVRGSIAGNCCGAAGRGGVACAGGEGGLRIVLGAFVYPTCKVWGPVKCGDSRPRLSARSAAPLLPENCKAGTLESLTNNAPAMAASCKSGIASPGSIASDNRFIVRALAYIIPSC